MRSVLHEYDVCIVAAGARTDMAVFQYLEGAELLVDALEVAHGRFKPGKRVVMIGGGMIGLTISEFLAKAGHEVTVVEKEKRIGGDIMPTFKWRHTAWVDELGIQTVTLAQLVKVTKEGATVKTAKGEEEVHPLRQRDRLQPAQGQPRPVLRVPVDGRRVARRRRRHGPATTCRRRRQQPEFLFDLPELKFPEHLNCVPIRCSTATSNGARRPPVHPGPRLRWTYADLQAQANRIANVLVHDLGLVPGNRVLLRAPNNPMLAACWFA
jgi:hypothetical protein